MNLYRLKRDLKYMMIIYNNSTVQHANLFHQGFLFLFHADIKHDFYKTLLHIIYKFPFLVNSRETQVQTLELFYGYTFTIESSTLSKIY